MIIWMILDEWIKNSALKGRYVDKIASSEEIGPQKGAIYIAALTYRPGLALQSQFMYLILYWETYGGHGKVMDMRVVWMVAVPRHHYHLYRRR